MRKVAWCQFFLSFSRCDARYGNNVDVLLVVAKVSCGA